MRVYFDFMRTSTLRGTLAASFQIASRSSIGSFGNQVNESKVDAVKEGVSDINEAEVSTRDEAFEEDVGFDIEGAPNTRAIVDDDGLSGRDEVEVCNEGEVSEVAMMRNSYVEHLAALQRSCRPMETGSAAETGGSLLRCNCFVTGDRRPRRHTDQFRASRH